MKTEFRTTERSEPTDVLAAVAAQLSRKAWALHAEHQARRAEEHRRAAFGDPDPFARRARTLANNVPPAPDPYGPHLDQLREADSRARQAVRGKMERVASDDADFERRFREQRAADLKAGRS